MHRGPKYLLSTYHIGNSRAYTPGAQILAKYLLYWYLDVGGARKPSLRLRVYKEYLLWYLVVVLEPKISGAHVAQNSVTF